MNLKLISPVPNLNKTISGVSWLEVDTPIGNFVILQEHAPTILILKENSFARYGLQTGKQAQIQIAQGLLYVKKDSLTILLNE